MMLVAAWPAVRYPCMMLVAAWKAVPYPCGVLSRCIMPAGCIGSTQWLNQRSARPRRQATLFSQEQERVCRTKHPSDRKLAAWKHVAQTQTLPLNDVNGCG